MKLILERFRQFEKDVIKEKYRDTWSHSAARKGRQQMRPVSAGGEPVAPHLKNVTQTIAKHVLMMVDPTGVSAYPDVADSYKDMTKDPSLGNVSLFALNAISAIPVIGLIGKPFKALTIAKKIAGLKKARKTLKGTTELVDSIKKAPSVNQGLITKLDDALKKAEETLVKAEEAIARLKMYMLTNQGIGMVSKENLDTLLKMAKAGKAVGHSGKAFRGARADDVMHLVDQLKIPGIKNRTNLDYMAHRVGRGPNPVNQADHFFRKELQKVRDSGGEWVEILLPTKATKLNSGRGVSFTRNWKQAETFADQSNMKHGDKFEIIFQTSGDNFINVAKTLDKHKVKIPGTFRSEDEVLAIGDVVVEKIFVRRAQ